MLGHHLLDVGAGSIADLQGLAVEDFAHQGALGEALVDQGQELGAAVGVEYTEYAGYAEYAEKAKYAEYAEYCQK